MSDDVTPLSIAAGAIALAVAAIKLVPMLLSRNGKERGLNPQQKIEVREMIEDLVIRQNDKGGLHWIKNKITVILWAIKEHMKIDLGDK